jgi:hypothetical protein
MIAHIKPPEPPADTVLVVKNIHIAECGPPPRLVDDSDARVLTLYFRSGMADQLLLQYDPKKRIGILRGGDTGWDNEIEIRDDALTTNTILSDDELSMIEAAWKMWTRRDLQMPASYKLAEKLRRAMGEG